MRSTVTNSARRRLLTSLLVSGGVHATVVAAAIVDPGFGWMPLAYTPQSNANSVEIVSALVSVDSAPVVPIVSTLDAEPTCEPAEARIPTEILSPHQAASVSGPASESRDSLLPDVPDPDAPKLQPISRQLDSAPIATRKKTPAPFDKLLDPSLVKPPITKSTEQQQPQVNTIAADANTMETAEVQGAEFDQLPTPVFNPSPIYPTAALAEHREGRVLLRATVDESGAVAEVTVLKSSGDDEMDAAAAAAVRTWKFTPGRRLGRNASGSVAVPIVFRISQFD